jgi:hypothetical protein
LDQLAKETNFVQRERKLDGETFLELIVFHNENLKEQSLEYLSGILKHEYTIHITKMALHKRFNKYAVNFLKTALEKLLQQQLQTSAIHILESSFNRVLIKDSVCFQVDNSLAATYPGSGGNSSDAAIRIQFEYDLLTGTITDISINAFNLQDSKDSLATIEKTKKGDLIIRDLAYMSLDVLKKIIEKSAIYLCRPNSNVTMYELKNGQYEKLDFDKIAKHMKNNNIATIEKEIYYGSIDKIKTRLILHLLPSEELEKRLRKASKNAKKDGRKLTKEYKARAALNLFITNASQEQIPTSNVWPIYRLRWQIELMFKIWKSICDIEKVKKVNIHRLECYIYSKLIFIVLGWKMLWIIAKNMYSLNNKPLSFYKAFKTLFKRQIAEFQHALQASQKDIIKFMVDFYNLSLTNHLLEKRKQKLTSLEIILACLK